MNMSLVIHRWRIRQRRGTYRWELVISLIAVRAPVGERKLIAAAIRAHRPFSPGYTSRTCPPVKISMNRMRDEPAAARLKASPNSVSSGPDTPGLVLAEEANRVARVDPKLSMAVAAGRCDVGFRRVDEAVFGDANRLGESPNE
jgi:hypothetical protein